MYHNIRITGLDQHTHGVLWRGCKTNIPPDVVVMASLSFGDRPAGNIATVTLCKTAKMS